MTPHSEAPLITHGMLSPPRHQSGSTTLLCTVLARASLHKSDVSGFLRYRHQVNGGNIALNQKWAQVLDQSPLTQGIFSDSSNSRFQALRLQRHVDLARRSSLALALCKPRTRPLRSLHRNPSHIKPEIQKLNYLWRHKLLVSLPFNRGATYSPLSLDWRHD